MEASAGSVILFFSLLAFILHRFPRALQLFFPLVVGRFAFYTASSLQLPSKPSCVRLTIVSSICSMLTIILRSSRDRSQDDISTELLPFSLIKLWAQGPVKTSELAFKLLLLVVLGKAPA